MCTLIAYALCRIDKICLIIADIGCAVIAVAYLQLMCWHTAAYNQSQRVRSYLLKSILRQDISWFDVQEPGEFNTRLVE